MNTSSAIIHPADLCLPPTQTVDITWLLGNTSPQENS